MTYINFVERMAEKNRISKRMARRVISVFLDMVRECLLKNESIIFKDFMSFGVKESAPITRRDFVSKEVVVHDSKKVPFCRFSDKLKNEIVEGKGGEEYERQENVEGGDSETPKTRYTRKF